MMKNRIIICLVAVFLSLEVFSQTILPTPFEMETETGRFTLKTKQLSVFVEGDSVQPFISLFCQTMTDGKPVKRVKSSAKADVCWLRDASLPSEGYRIVINKKGISIAASDNAGYIYAIQTLRQWGEATKNGWSFVYGTVYDFPRSAWRSFMLDSGRQFQRVETIKKYIDMASMLKMNRFHWHLTEGLGWRIEIKKYPELARIGGSVAKGQEQQGYYTQEQIKEIIRYAAERNVTVVPEIDMPGHAEAALSVYPSLGCTGEPVEVPETGFTQNIFCAGKASVRNFLKDVLDEVCNLFPSAYIHLGGDEAPKGNWDKCPHCRLMVDSLQLADSHALQLWFSAEMADYLKRKGKKAIFWEDVIHGDGYPLPDNVVIQWWNYRGHKDLALKKALEKGYPVICNTNYYTYLNFPVMPWRGYDKNRTFDIKDVYLNNPSDKALDLETPLVLGMNCALWTDYVLTEDMLDSRLFPRVIALAEQMWHSGERMSFESFNEQIEKKRSWFESFGFNFDSTENDDIILKHF